MDNGQDLYKAFLPQPAGPARIRCISSLGLTIEVLFSVFQVRAHRTAKVRWHRTRNGVLVGKNSYVRVLVDTAK